MTNPKNNKKIWNGIKQIVHFKPKTMLRVTKIIHNDVQISDPKTVADSLNNYFANIGINLSNSIPKVQKSPMNYLAKPVCNSFFLSSATVCEIETEISKLNSSKTRGPLCIPTYILKLIKEIVAKPLETLFNVSFITGIVPSSLKVANVIPVYKKGSQFSFCNYRPISLLSIFNKLLEKLVSKRLIKFIEKENILFSKQFGFRAKHSTDHAILSITDEIQRAIDEGYYSCGIFLDFSKAFDTVNHTILLRKLEYYSIRGITGSWFNSYLSNRQQTVTLNNITSTSTLTSCGVPQGSVLGPL